MSDYQHWILFCCIQSLDFYSVCTFTQELILILHHYLDQAFYQFHQHNDYILFNFHLGFNLLILDLEPSIALIIFFSIFEDLCLIPIYQHFRAYLIYLNFILMVFVIDIDINHFFHYFIFLVMHLNLDQLNFFLNLLHPHLHLSYWMECL